MELPADRESFYEAQHRHRRAARWQTWLVAVALAVQSLPLGVVLFAMVTNLLYVVVLITAISSDAASSGPPAILSLIDPLRTPVVLAPPFTVLMVALVWRVGHGRFLRAAMTGLLRGLDARAPDHTDLEERQLINVVAEMAVAAGITPPRVLMLDASLSNAALLGIARDEAVVVVPRQLLDDVDRGELQAVLGHLISSVVNGDLWVADALFVLQLVHGLVGYVLQRMAGGHPESPRLWRVLRDPDDADVAAHAVRVLLADPGSRANENLVVRLLRVLWNDLVARPLATAMWRRRCLLADATAVALTRDPDALAGALTALAGERGWLPDAADAEQFFFVWPAPAGGRRTRNWAGMSTALHPAIEQRLAQARSLGAALPRLGL